METKQAIIRTKTGSEIIVDATLYDELSKYTWYLHNNGGYAARHVKRNGKDTCSLMHREIIGVTDSSVCVDHINRNPLDNRRCNLRLATKSENGRNRPRQKNGTNIYKCIYRTAPSYKRPYFVQIKVHGKPKYYGAFDTLDEALDRYNSIVADVHGEFAFFQERIEGVI